jgi:diguanylate cyclase (GGDEF)-like protein
MLSESTQTGMSGTAAQLRRLLYARGRTARLWGIAAGSVVLAFVTAAMVLVPAVMAIGLALVVPVALLAWFGGVWTGTVGAAMAALAVVLSAVANGVPLDGGVLLSTLLTAAVLMVIVEVLPVLRIESQSYREHAQTDPLTNLGNRRFFREVALVELNRSKRYSRPVSLIYLDIEGFGRIRHERGHAESDLLLVQVASVLSGALRTSDVVARISGAEFAILLPETDGEGARVVARKVCDRLTGSVTESGDGVSLRAAVVGVSAGPVSLEPMLRQLDETMLDARAGDGLVSYREYEHPPMQLV